MRRATRETISVVLLFSGAIAWALATSQRVTALEVQQISDAKINGIVVDMVVTNAVLVEQVTGLRKDTNASRVEFQNWVNMAHPRLKEY